MTAGHSLHCVPASSLLHAACLDQRRALLACGRLLATCLACRIEALLGGRQQAAIAAAPCCSPLPALACHCTRRSCYQPSARGLRAQGMALALARQLRDSSALTNFPCEIQRSWPGAVQRRTRLPPCGVCLSCLVSSRLTQAARHGHDMGCTTCAQLSRSSTIITTVVADRWH